MSCHLDGWLHGWVNVIRHFLSLTATCRWPIKKSAAKCCQTNPYWLLPSTRPDVTLFFHCYLLTVFSHVHSNVDLMWLSKSVSSSSHFVDLFCAHQVCPPNSQQFPGAIVFKCLFSVCLILLLQRPRFTTVCGHWPNQGDLGSQTNRLIFLESSQLVMTVIRTTSLDFKSLTQSASLVTLLPKCMKHSVLHCVSEKNGPTLKRSSSKLKGSVLSVEWLVLIPQSEPLHHTSVLCNIHSTSITHGQLLENCIEASNFVAINSRYITIHIPPATENSPFFKIISRLPLGH